ncbi:MAG: hypothetical protein DWH91_13855 [Planctomycetota bacterium]|nr:MAG: hypothetical protein DWH91_13855 [Planctomycetota bacterium]
MSGPMSVSCPHCGAGLKLKNQNFVGKKVPCPKCRTPFKVEPPEDDLFGEVDDDYGAMDESGDDDELPEMPRPKSTGKAKGGKGKKKSKGSGNAGRIAMMVGGILLGIGLLGGLVYGTISLIGSSGGGNSWVKWLPEETDLVVRVRVADAMNAPVFQPFTADPVFKKLLDNPGVPTGGDDPGLKFIQGLNLKLSDIESVTVGQVNALAAAGSPPSMGFSGFSSVQSQKFVGVIRLKTPLEMTKFEQAPANAMVKEDYSGKAIYALAGLQNPRVLVYPVDGSTIVFGSDVELKAAVDAGGSSPARSRYAFADETATVVVAMAPKDLNKLKSVGMKQFQVKGNLTTETSDITSIYGQAFQVTLNSDIVYEERTNMSRSMVSGSVDSKKEEIAKAQSGFQIQKAGLLNEVPILFRGQVEPLLTHVETMLKSGTVTAEGSNLCTRMTLSGKLISDARAAMNPFMPMITAQIDEMVKQSAAAAPMAAPSAPIGNSAMDVMNYPSTVINAGHSAQTRAENSADQHNSAIQAAMNEGAPAGHSAATPPSSADPNALMRAAAAQQNAGGGAPAGHASPPAGAIPVGAIPPGGGAPAGHAAPPAGAIPPGAGAPAPQGDTPNGEAKPAQPKSRRRR